VNFSSDLAGFVDRQILEMLHFALLDPSAGSSISPSGKEKEPGCRDYTDARKRVDVRPL
jgi:hypothetical protein